MKISAISHNNLKPHYQNFSGVFKNIGSSFDKFDFQEDGTPAGVNISRSYIYYPFADEPEYEINDVMQKNNFSYNMDPKKTGYYGTHTGIVELGQPLPYTRGEWEEFNQSEKDNILNTLG